MENLRIIIDSNPKDSLALAPDIIFRDSEIALVFIEDYFDVIAFVGVEHEFATEDLQEKLKDIFYYKKPHHCQVQVIGYTASVKE